MPSRHPRRSNPCFNVLELFDRAYEQLSDALSYRDLIRSNEMVGPEGLNGAAQAAAADRPIMRRCSDILLDGKLKKDIEFF